MPQFRVWCDDGREEADNTRTLEACDVRRAAQLHADIIHPQWGWECSWPITFRVRELETGRLFDVEVDRDMEPVFRPGKPVEVTPAPAPPSESP